MKTIIQGKNLETTYGVNHKWIQLTNREGEVRTVYGSKPELTDKTVVKNWETIIEFDETIEFNSSGSSYYKIGEINLSESEVVSVIDKTFRADLGAYVLHTNKVLSETELKKADSEETLVCQVKAFNKMMIESNSKLLSYCKLLKLNLEDTDVDELFKIVFPNSSYSIEGGVITENCGVFLTGTGLTFTHDNWETCNNGITACMASTIKLTVQ